MENSSSTPETPAVPGQPDADLGVQRATRVTGDVAGTAGSRSSRATGRPLVLACVAQWAAASRPSATMVRELAARHADSILTAVVDLGEPECTIVPPEPLRGAPRAAIRLVVAGRDGLHGAPPADERSTPPADERSTAAGGSTVDGVPMTGTSSASESLTEGDRRSLSGCCTEGAQRTPTGDGSPEMSTDPLDIGATMDTDSVIDALGLEHLPTWIRFEPLDEGNPSAGEGRSSSAGLIRGHVMMHDGTVRVCTWRETARIDGALPKHEVGTALFTALD